MLAVLPFLTVWREYLARTATYHMRKLKLRREPEASGASHVQHQEGLVEELAFYAAVLSAIAISIADMAGALDGFPWLSNRIPQITLILVSLFILYSARRPLDPRHLSEGIMRELLDELPDELRSLQGTSMLTFEKPEDLYRYVAMKVRDADYTVDDITWGSRSAYRSEAEMQAYNTYLAAMKQACQKPTVIYREVSSLSDLHYYQRAKDLIDLGTLSYSLGYYDIANIGIPLVSYIIVDGREVNGWFYRDPGGHAQAREVYVRISHPVLVRLFQDYFQTLWEESTKIKEYDKVNYQLLEEIGERLKPEV